MYEKELKSVGLSDNEVGIYLLLLKHGVLNPTEIAKRLGLHRGYVYDALERMQDKQVINVILKNNKKHFQATTPELLAESLKFKLERFQSVLPALLKLQNHSNEGTKVELYKGKRVYRTLLQDMVATLKNSGEALLIGIDEQTLLTEVEPVYLRQYMNIVKEQGITEKIIIKKGAKRLRHKHFTYRALPKEYIGNTAQILYETKTALLLLGSPRYLIVIDDQQVTETYRKQFMLLWKHAKTVNSSL